MERESVEKLGKHSLLKKHIKKYGPQTAERYWEGCKNFVRAAQLRKGHRIVIIADKKHEPLVMGIADAAGQKGVQVWKYVKGSKKNRMHEKSEGFKAAVELVKNVKPHATFLLVDKEAWPARRPIYEATTKSETNGFTITCPDIRHKDVSEILHADPLPVQRRTRKVTAILQAAASKGAEIRLDTGKSVFTARLTKKSSVIADDMAPPKGEFLPGVKIANMPGGEAEINGLEGIDGEVVFGSGSLIGGDKGGHLKDGVKMKFKDGKLLSISKPSKRDAPVIAELNKFFRKHGKDMVEPFSIGTNEHILPEHATTNLTQEKILGTIHIGVGDNDKHADLIAYVQHLTVGGKHLIKNGKWVLN